MPIYEYVCETCGVIEVKQSIKADALVVCPVCANKIKRIISVTGAPQFKGSGFYKTDYKEVKS